MPSISTPDPQAAAPRRVGIVGPGLMGLGIAQAVAASGSKVVLCGRNAEAAQAGRLRLTAALEREIARGRLETAVGVEILARVEAAESDD
jgi:3-hydroxybutyryl-CoA dehydrogenase